MTELTRQQLENHGDTYRVIARVLSYTLGLWGCMFLASNYFGDTYFSNLSIFMVFSVVFELLWAGCASSSRMIGYLVCIAMIGVVSLGFVKQSDSQVAAKSNTDNPKTQQDK